jgi:dipeptidyl-peptidase-4
VTVVAFHWPAGLFVGGLLSGVARELVVDGPVFDPRPDPTARRVAYVCGNSLRIAELDGSSWELASDEDPECRGVPPTSSPAEEIHRNRGYWWSPDGTSVAACRVDVSQVDHWYIADPAAPDQPAHEVRYPAAGTPNAVVELHVLALDGGEIDVAWDRDRFPYLTAVSWVSEDRLLLDRPVARPTRSAGARGQSDDGRHVTDLRRPRRPGGSRSYRAFPTNSPTAGW